jgi:hypothetical protein
MPPQPVSPQRRRYGGTCGGNYCSVIKNRLIAQLLTREFDSNPVSLFGAQVTHRHNSHVRLAVDCKLVHRRSEPRLPKQARLCSCYELPRANSLNLGSAC